MPLTHPTRVDGYDAIRLRSASAHLDATFVPAAGMVGASLRDGGEELLGRGLGVHCYARGGTTMGIPLLHPWANRLAADEYRVNGTAVRLRSDSPLVAREEHGLPIHGLLGGSPHWALRHGDGNGQAAWALSAEIDFGAHPELLEAFPFPHRLALDVALRRRTLTVRTTLTATGEHAVPVSFGFHPYLRLPDVAREDWRVELPAMRHLQLDARSIPTGRHGPSRRPPARWARARSTTATSTSPTARSSSSPAAGAASPCASSRAIRLHRSSRRRRMTSSASSR
jgi:aldose 1-epimerase